MSANAHKKIRRVISTTTIGLTRQEASNAHVIPCKRTNPNTLIMGCTNALIFWAEFEKCPLTVTCKFKGGGLPKGLVIGFTFSLIITAIITLLIRLNYI